MVRGGAKPAVGMTVYQGLSRREERVLVALLDGGTLTETAAACGLKKRTVDNIIGRERFRQAYRAARNDVRRAVVGRLISKATKAVDTLAEVMDSAESDSARVAAARAVLDMATRYSEREDVVERIEALERDRGGEVTATARPVDLPAKAPPPDETV